MENDERLRPPGEANADTDAEAQATVNAIKLISAVPRLFDAIEALKADIGAMGMQFEAFQRKAVNLAGDSSVGKRGGEKKFYNAKEAAAVLGVSVAAVRGFVRRGLLRKSKAYRWLLIPAEDIEKFKAETV